MPASDVRVIRVQNQAKPLNTSPSTVVGCCGLTERGPIGVERVLQSWQDYTTTYGGFTANVHDTPLQVKALFDEAGENGNVEVHMSRVVHCTTPGNPSTRTSAAAVLVLLTASLVPTSALVTSGNAETWSLQPNQHLNVAVDGAGAVVKTFTAAPAVLTGANAQTFALVNGWQITPTINGAVYPTFTFTSGMFAEGIGTANASSVVAAFNAYFAANAVPAVATVGAGNHVVVSSTLSGSSSAVSFANVSGTAVAVLGLGTPAAGSGNVSDISAVTLIEAEALLGTVSGITASSDGFGRLVLTSNTSGPSSSVQVTGASTASAFNFDNTLHTGVSGGTQTTLTVNGLWDGSYANSLSVEVVPPSSGSGTEFNLIVLDGGVQAEGWVNLSMDPSSPRYAPYVVNGPPTVNGLPGANLSGQAPSTLVSLTDALLYANSGVPLTLARPAGSVSPATGTTFGPLTGGSDGLAGLSDADWLGGVTTNGRTGLRVLDLVHDVALLICPGRATAVVHNAMINYCETVRSGLCFAVLDTPASLSAVQIADYVQLTAHLNGLSEMCAIYWPRIQVPNPDPSVFGQAATVVTGPSGSIAGLCARLDASKPGGSFEHPASIEKGFLTSAVGLEVIGGVAEVQDVAKRGLVFDALINPIMVKRGTPVYVDGARTLNDRGPFPTVGESRGVLSVQITLAEALDPKRNQSMRPRFYNEVTMKVVEYLTRLTAAECFSTRDNAAAWYFQMGPSINTPAVQASRTAVAMVGLSTSDPAEHIVVYVAPFRAPSTTAG